MTTAKKRSVKDVFNRISRKCAEAVGHFSSFIIAMAVIIVWAISGPTFHFSDTWQLVINTGTTIVTFLMVFLIQNTQNRDARALHLKLDELIFSMKEARNELIDIEDGEDEKLDELAKHFRDVHEQLLERRKSLREDTSRKS
jgi:low affinity Fe/Cu permease